MARDFLKMDFNMRWNNPDWQADRLTKKEEKKAKKEEKLYDDWIWVEGYKATDKNMMCRGTQYRFGEVFEMSENEPVIDCQSGYHLCLKLEDVFNYYRIGDGHRFFKVRALVRKHDVAEYHTSKPKNPYEKGTAQAAMWDLSHISMFTYNDSVRDKLAAKAIEFMYELSVDEVFEATDKKDWSHEEKVLTMAYDAEYALRHRDVGKLVSAGYSHTFAEYIAHNLTKDKIGIALAVASQPGLSMDVKVLTIMKGFK